MCERERKRSGEGIEQGERVRQGILIPVKEEREREREQRSENRRGGERRRRIKENDKRFHWKKNVNINC